MELRKSSRISEHAGAQLHKTHDRWSLDAVLDHLSLRLLAFWLMTETLLYCQHSFLQVSLCRLVLVPFFQIAWYQQKKPTRRKISVTVKELLCRASTGGCVGFRSGKVLWQVWPLILQKPHWKRKNGTASLTFLWYSVINTLKSITKLPIAVTFYCS